VSGLEDYCGSVDVSCCCEKLVAEARGIVREPRGMEMSAVGSRYRATTREDWEDFMCAAVTMIFGMWNSVRIS
jgi:hypothetical protein